MQYRWTSSKRIWLWLQHIYLYWQHSQRLLCPDRAVAYAFNWISVADVFLELIQLFRCATGIWDECNMETGYAEQSSSKTCWMFCRCTLTAKMSHLVSEDLCHCLPKVRADIIRNFSVWSSAWKIGTNGQINAMSKLKGICGKAELI